jgi:tetratricopeptide (TPR) repeat protein
LSKKSSVWNSHCNYINKSALYAPLSIVRVIERNSDKKLGNRFLAEGKNFLISNKGDDGFSARQVLLASALGNPTSRILIAGPQSPESLVTLRSVGPKEILVAASPPEIFRAMALAWNGASKDKTLDHCSSIADAEGKFGLVLIRDPVLWDGGHNLLRSAQLSIAASKVDNDGALGVLLDPERCSINLVGAIAQQLEKDLGSAAVWLVPNGWDTPGLLITGRAKRVGARLTHRVKNALIEAKLPIHNNSDLSLLQAVPKGRISELPSYSIRGPFPRFISKMQHTIWKRIEGGEPGKRAAKLLHRLMDFSEDTPAHAFLSFYSSHLGGQVYEVRDTFPGAEAWEKTELTKESLDSLFLLSKKNTNSDFLRDFWAQLTPLLVEKREVAWCFEYMSAFCDPDLFPSWGQPVFHWALGNAALEMLDYESAIAEANRILSKNRSHRRALILLAQSLSSAGRHPASANAYRKVISLEDPAPALLVALAEEELAAGLLDDARSTCAKVLEMGGESSLSKELRALMGLLPPEPIAHPEMGGPLR